MTKPAGQLIKSTDPLPRGLELTMRQMEIRMERLGRWIYELSQMPKSMRFVIEEQQLKAWKREFDRIERAYNKLF